MATDGRQQAGIQRSLVVGVVQKQDQRSGKTIRGVVAEDLTKAASPPHGIKVRLTDDRVGRVIAIICGDSD